MKIVFRMAALEKTRQVSDDSNQVEVSSLDVRSCKWRRLYHSWCIAHFGSNSFISLKDDRQNAICAIILTKRFKYLKETSTRFLITCSTTKYLFQLYNAVEACLFENVLLQLVSDCRREPAVVGDQLVPPPRPIKKCVSTKVIHTYENVDSFSSIDNRQKTTKYLSDNIIEGQGPQRPRCNSIRQNFQHRQLGLLYSNSQQKMLDGIRRISQRQRLYNKMGSEVQQVNKIGIRRIDSHQDLDELLSNPKTRHQDRRCSIIEEAPKLQRAESKRSSRAEIILNQKICPQCRSAANPLAVDGKHLCTQEPTEEVQKKDSKPFEDFLSEFKRKKAVQSQHVHLVHSILPHEHVLDCSLCKTPNKGLCVSECMHNFCRECMIEHISKADTCDVRCPLCEAIILTKDIRQILSPADYAKFVKRTIDSAEENGCDVFCCRTSGCHGWSVVYVETDTFKCPLCARVNCLKCQDEHKYMKCDRLQALVQNFPVTWYVMTPYDYDVIVRLDSDSGEYKDIVSFMRKQLTADCVVKKIERCQNTNLWEKYEMEKKNIREESGYDELKERVLFHGSTHTDPVHILREGLWPDRSYFAENSTYSLAHAYHVCGNTYQMISAKVLTGSNAVSQIGDVYTVDNSYLAYPNYLITFDTVL